jgi:hypothetical protein
MTCNLQTLIQQACSNGFITLAQTDAVLSRAIKLQLLCNLSAGGGGGGGNAQLVVYTSGVPANPPNVALPAMAYDPTGNLPTMGWNTANQTWN